MRKPFYIFVLLLFCTLIIYSNHFNNAFHFDDQHTVENNAYIRDIKNIPLFFKDASTFSTLPQNQSYRPVVTTSLAVDYWLGKGKLFYFHLSSFLLFLAQGFLMLLFFLKLFKSSYQKDSVYYIAVIAAAWYLWHPANAETVNYVIARSDLQSTFFVVLAFVLYAYSAVARKTGLYLVPVAIGALAKISAVMFAPMLFFYIAFFEENISLQDVFRKSALKQTGQVIKKSLPAFIACGLLYLFVSRFTPATYETGGPSVFQYLITQPYVILHYFLMFFLPVDLSADTDWGLLPSIADIRFFAGMGFLIAMVAAAFYCSKRDILRPISFGILWFFLALIPTSSIIPFAEVLNDHRMFFPFVGLAASVCWALYLGLSAYINRRAKKFSFATIATLVFVLLAAYGFGTYKRNQVWRTEESLWYDVTVKSPGNGRGLMNYGLAKMSQGDYKTAETYFTRALKLTPDYALLYVNMGILKEAAGDKAAAEKNFQKAIELGDTYPDCWFFYGRFLYAQNRYDEAIPALLKTVELYPGYLQARLLLMRMYEARGEYTTLQKFAQNTLQVLPNNPDAALYLQAATSKKNKIDIEAEVLKKAPDAIRYVDLSLAYYKLGRYQDCADAAKEAIKLKPDYAEAYNNAGTAYNMLHQYDSAIIMLTKAIALKPGFELAKNNLRLAQNSKADLADVTAAATNRTPESYLNLSLQYYNAGQYELCIAAAKKAIALKPDYALAYNNICSAYNQLKQWDNAIAAGEQALKLDPNYQLAKNNLAIAKRGQQKK